VDKLEDLFKDLISKALEEIESKQEAYGDTWRTVELETLLHVVKNDAARLPITKDKESLKHRIVDITAYLGFVWAKLSEE